MQAMSVKDFSLLGGGLTTDRELHYAAIVRDVSQGDAELRRIDPSDPKFPWAAQQQPPHVYGIWERNVGGGLANWAFTFAEMSLDDRVIARLVEADMHREGVDPRRARMLAHETGRQLSKAKADAEREEARRDEMAAIGRLADKKSSFRHKIDGETYIIGDTVRKVGTTIGRSGR